MKSVKVGEIRYRIVCSKYGQECHGTHVWEMKNRPAAEEAKARYDGLDRRDGCAPWTIQGRAVSEWGDPDAAEMCLYAIGRTIRGQLL